MVLAGIAIALECRQGFVQDFPFGGRGFITADEVSLMQFREPCKELRAVARAQPWEFFKNLDFAHARNLLLCGKFSKPPIDRSPSGWGRNVGWNLLLATFTPPPSRCGQEISGLRHGELHEFCALVQFHGRGFKPEFQGLFGVSDRFLFCVSGGSAAGQFREHRRPAIGFGVEFNQ